jgi:predicted nucleic acid-binding protein
LLAQVAALAIVPDDAPPVEHWLAVITLANRHRLSVYDGAYLELAM